MGLITTASTACYDENSKLVAVVGTNVILSSLPSKIIERLAHFFTRILIDWKQIDNTLPSLDRSKKCTSFQIQESTIEGIRGDQLCHPPEPKPDLALLILILSIVMGTPLLCFFIVGCVIFLCGGCNNSRKNKKNCWKSMKIAENQWKSWIVSWICKECSWHVFFSDPMEQINTQAIPIIHKDWNQNLDDTFNSTKSLDPSSSKRHSLSLMFLDLTTIKPFCKHNVNIPIILSKTIVWNVFNLWLQELKWLCQSIPFCSTSPKNSPFQAVSIRQQSKLFCNLINFEKHYQKLFFPLGWIHLKWILEGLAYLPIWQMEPFQNLE